MAKFTQGHPEQQRQMQLELVKIGDFQQITCYNLKTVQDRRTFSIKVKQEVFCVLLNGSSSANSATMNAMRIILNFYILCCLRIFLVGAHRHFKFGGQVHHTKSQPTDDKPSLKGTWSRHVTNFKVLVPLKYLWNNFCADKQRNLNLTQRNLPTTSYFTV